MRLILLLILGLFWKHCDTQVNREEANGPPDGPGGDDGAFFALRSCHQLLNSDKAEFFSPDYLCSNPPLWCNWTIQVDPGKRIQLDLEDLTPDDACHLKQDQIHVDEPAGQFGGHKVLQKCWREAKYTSSSNIVHVVLLIGQPILPYRGFFGRYQAFGPLVVYNPLEGFAERSRKPSTRLDDLGLDSEIGPGINGEQMESDLPEDPSPANSDVMRDYYDQGAVLTDELPWEAEEVSENDHHVDPVTAGPTVPASTQRTSRSGRGLSHMPSTQSAIYAVSPKHKHDQNPELKPATHNQTPRRRNVEEAAGEPSVPETNTQSWRGDKMSADSSHNGNRSESSEGSDQNPATSGGPESEDIEQVHPHPSMVELLSDYRGNSNVRNHSVNPHLPGDQLFEAAVEVDFSQDLDESWDNQARSLLLSVKALIREKLETTHVLLSMSSKRIKRLNAGVLYILWLQIRQEPGTLQVHRSVHSTLQGLISTSIYLRENHGKAVVMSVSTADVNECGTQLVLCDINADCVNQFGSYSCHCRPGFRDVSRLGSGGTICMDVKAAGCSSGLSPETKGVYVLFFLLSCFILMPLVVVGILYHRHHRGTFLVRCHSSSTSSPDLSNDNHHHDDNYSYPAESDLPPPTPSYSWPQRWLAAGEGAPSGRGRTSAAFQLTAATSQLRGITGEWEAVTLLHLNYFISVLMSDTVVHCSICPIKVTSKQHF
uniref:CUB domain-containing protein n=2 Tax=Anabas testudineus TaxID=64144 RepID=A0A7N6F9Y8_ANATE